MVRGGSADEKEIILAVDITSCSPALDFRGGGYLFPSRAVLAEPVVVDELIVTVSGKLTLEQTAYYLPSGDVFTLHFTQLDNLGKYWGQEGRAEESLAPRHEAPLRDMPLRMSYFPTSAARQTEYQSPQATKIADFSTEPIYDTIPLPANGSEETNSYTYRVTATAPPPLETATGERSWTDPSESYILTLKVDEWGSIVEIGVRLESDLSQTLNDDSDQWDNLSFSSQLTASQTIMISKRLEGTGLTPLDREQTYPINVTLEGLQTDLQTDTGVSFGPNQPRQTLNLADGETVKLFKVPVGTKIQLAESGQPGMSAMIEAYNYEWWHTETLYGKPGEGIAHEAWVSMNLASDAEYANRFAFINSRQDVVNTAVSHRSPPYGLALLLAGLALAGYALCQHHRHHQSS